MIGEWRADKIIKKIADATGESIGKASEGAQKAMKESTSSEFYDTGTLNRSIRVQESSSFSSVDRSTSSPELGTSGKKAMIKDGKVSLFVGSGQFYIKYLFKYGYGGVVGKGLSAAKAILKAGFKI